MSDLTQESFKHSTSGLGVTEAYTGTNLGPRNFFINLILLPYTHLGLDYPDHRNILLLHTDDVSLLVYFCVLFLPVNVWFFSPESSSPGTVVEFDSELFNTLT